MLLTSLGTAERLTSRLVRGAHEKTFGISSQGSPRIEAGISAVSCLCACRSRNCPDRFTAGGRNDEEQLYRPLKSAGEARILANAASRCKELALIMNICSSVQLEAGSFGKRGAHFFAKKRALVFTKMRLLTCSELSAVVRRVLRDR